MRMLVMAVAAATLGWAAPGDGHVERPATGTGGVDRSESVVGSEASAIRGTAVQEKSKAKGKKQAPGQSRAQANEQARGNKKAQAKKKGQAKPQARGNKPGQGRGQPAERRARPANPRGGEGARGGPPAHAAAHGARGAGPTEWRSALTPRLERLLEQQRRGPRLAAVALAHGRTRGLDDDQLEIRLLEDRVRVLDRDGRPLLDLDEDRSRRLGSWDVVRTDRRGVRGGAPAFCRSGEGHPVWGRDWCFDKGFGLGTSRDLRWGRSTRIEDVIFRTPRERRRVTLRDVLDDVVLDRLALHALTLGASEPLVGYWLGEPAGPRVLRLEAGGLPVAELVDYDRDERADVLLVSLR